MSQIKQRLMGGASVFVTIIVVVVIIAIILALTSNFFYFFEKVDEQEVGLQFEGGRISDVVGPGVYNDMGLFVSMVRVSSQAIPFSITDEEIITKDKQRIGLIVNGTIFRPDTTQKDLLRTKWAKYRGIYLENDTAIGQVQALTRQSMKVCVGDRTFDDNIIGTARDALRQCIDDELNELAREYGLNIRNLVVPEVILSEEVQVALDAIVQSRLETEKAAQDKLRAEAQAEAEQSRQEGEIRIAQSRLQEETKQQTLLAQLEQEKILAQKVVIEAERANELARVQADKAVIEAQKANELLAAEQDLAINTALAEAAVEKAKADLAPQMTLAELYANNPEYLNLQIVRANADALQPTDKLIFTPEGMVPTLVLPGPGIVPTVDTGASTNPGATSQKQTQQQPAESESTGEAESDN